MKSEQLAMFNQRGNAIEPSLPAQFVPAEIPTAIEGPSVNLQERYAALGKIAKISRSNNKGLNFIEQTNRFGARNIVADKLAHSGQTIESKTTDVLKNGRNRQEASEKLFREKVFGETALTESSLMHPDDAADMTDEAWISFRSRHFGLKNKDSGLKELEKIVKAAH